MKASELLIDKIETWACSVPLASPIDFGSFVARERHYVALRIRTREGLVADCIAQSRGSPIDVVLLDVIAPHLIEKSASDIETRRLEVERAVTALEFDGAIGRAWSLAEICLNDLRAQFVKQPMWKLLGGVPRKIPVQLVEGYALVGESDEAFAARLAERVAEGYQAIKIEAGHYSDGAELLRRLQLFRKIAGPKCKIVLDFAWGWTSVADRLDLLGRLYEIGIDWIEDPFSRHQIANYKALRNRSSIAIGCGDETTRPSDLLALIDADALDVVRTDATTMGGFGPVRQLCGIARSKKLRVSFHERPEVHEHCAFGFDSADHIELFPVDRPFDCAHDLLQTPVIYRVEKGMLSAPLRPGTGIRLQDSAIQKWAKRNAAVSI